jgi:tripartite-type tricarboxylate transporter receptor subunit TctC
MTIRRLALLTAAAASLAGSAAAQDGKNFPNKPIRVLVGFTPGGGIDTVARVVAQEAAKEFSVPIIVENKPGLGGSIAGEAVARAEADGHTLFVTAPGSAVINPHLIKELGYKFEDTKAVTLIGLVPLVVVTHPGTNLHALGDLVSQAKASPGKLNYGTVGVGTSNHMATALFEMTAGVQMTHVPYKGPQANTDLLAGRLDLIFDAITTATPFIKENQYRPLAVTTKVRSPMLPNVPTIAESGFPDYEASNWYGIVAPAQTPADIVAKLNAAFVKAIRSPEVTKRLEGMGVIVSANSSAEFDQFLATQYRRMGEVVRATGAKPQ